MSGERAAEEQRVGQSGRQSRTWKNTAQGRPLCLLRNARCETRCAEGGVRKARSACWRSPLRRLAGRLISNRGGARSACWRSPLRRLAGRLISNRWGGEVGLLALAATEAGRPAYFHPMGRRGRAVHRSLHGRRGWHLCAGVEGPPGALKTPCGLDHPFGGAVFVEWGGRHRRKRRPTPASQTLLLPLGEMFLRTTR